MPSWVCERCGFLHVDAKAVRAPSRCPNCGSRRLRPTPRVKELEIRREGVRGSGGTRPPHELYHKMRSLARLPVEEQERVRGELKQLGVHVLCVKRDEGLDRLLGAKEAQTYLRMVEEEGSGLALIEGGVVAVSADSMLRPHVGVSTHLLDELRKAAQRYTRQD